MVALPSRVFIAKVRETSAVTNVIPRELHMTTVKSPTAVGSSIIASGKPAKPTSIASTLAFARYLQVR
jgi:hypothetical protein